MSEKSKLPSRLLFYLFSVSMFLLILSSIFLLQFGSTSIPSLVLTQILVNSTSVYFSPSVQSEPSKLPSIPSKPITEVDCPSLKMVASGQDRKKICDSSEAVLRVYMYDLPPEFHFGLLGWKWKENQTWPGVDNIPPYPGGLNLQHSIEYWLTLDLLASNSESLIRPCSVVRVQNSSQADVIFVPFFSSLSYNRFSKLRGKEKISLNLMLQNKLVQFLMARDEWKQFKGKDHLIIAHHPNSMLKVRKKLGSAMFVLADFGRYHTETANLEKDIIAPYKHVVRTTPSEQSAQFNQRPTLVYFQGAIYRKAGGAIRQELYYLLKDENDVHFTFGSVQGHGINSAGKGMASSKFCLNIAGDTPSSNRLFDAIVSHCVPVIISDNIELPFEDVLDYSEFCVFVRASDAVKKGYLLNLLRGIKRDKWTKMWERLKEISPHFEYQYPSQSGDAVDMIWRSVYHKTSLVRLNINRKNRYHQAEAFLKGN
ncbi:hypothetical protein K2173_028146 [Erythroxylum novogranatense]|uniref:Exostosin GT47 domain-containing protein n=1 Tax=Erythroxylum novogranatense TaxID=1862640 RepID=A0AAV8U407_9ROSI|nr:hypothetical protein K2173_028146 [Erythroxylum novogranatense]